MSKQKKRENKIVDRSGIIFGARAAEKKVCARKLRREMTDAESVLLQRRRAGRPGGLQIRRQQIIDGFIVDFFNLNAGLIIKADGPIHAEQAKEDAHREEAFTRRDFSILRFPNESVLNDLESVLTRILTASQDRVASATRRT